MTGKGSVNHNSRKFHAKNTDPERSYLNIEYINENIEDVYHELFDEALARYNEKQSRKDRYIDNYYEKIRAGKQEKTFHEIILQIGDKDNMGAKTEDGQLAAKILNEYMQDFQQRIPTLRVFSAYLHMEEATEFELGYLIYFFEKACAVSGYILGVNPFNQPGVESYKSNMFALLGKPGYEDRKEALEAKLK